MCARNRPPSGSVAAVGGELDVLLTQGGSNPGRERTLRDAQHLAQQANLNYRAGTRPECCADCESPQLSRLQQLVTWRGTCRQKTAPVGSRPRTAWLPRPRRFGRRSCTKDQPCCTVVRVATMNISTARDSLPDAVELARTEAVFLERYGRPAAVLVSPEQYEKLTAALEDAQDVAAFDEAMAEEGPNIPWDEVKVDLGWT